ncbi:hypothetical protein ACGFNU_22055 [Spirillospora sp. NPDC048911]|uniref:hypothetical protein n=1 Tax=Spirillospora sp. NPDC048911 TaxID=3364527 RepID=UPI00371A05F8
MFRHLLTWRCEDQDESSATVTHGDRIAPAIAVGKSGIDHSAALAYRCRRQNGIVGGERHDIRW